MLRKTTMWEHLIFHKTPTPCVLFSKKIHVFLARELKLSRTQEKDVQRLTKTLTSAGESERREWWRNKVGKKQDICRKCSFKIKIKIKEARINRLLNFTWHQQRLWTADYFRLQPWESECQLKLFILFIRATTKCREHRERLLTQNNSELWPSRQHYELRNSCNATFRVRAFFGWPLESYSHKRLVSHWSVAAEFRIWMKGSLCDSSCLDELRPC